MPQRVRGRRSKHSREFEDAILSKLLDPSVTVSEVAADADLHESTIRTWIKKRKKEAGI